MKNIFVLFFLLLFCRTHSQTIHTTLNLSYEPEAIIKNRLETYRDTLLKSYSTSFKKEKDLKEFTEGVINTNSYYFNSGIIYYKWSEMENYLNNIVKDLLAEEYKEHIKVKVVRDAEINAFMIEDGTIYVHVGLLAYLNNEAELASVLGHEFGHYKMKHMMKSFKAGKKAESNSVLFNDPTIQLIKNINYYDNLQDLEDEADDVSLLLLKKSKHNALCIGDVFKIFEMQKKKYQGERLFERSLFNTHPSNSSRISNAKTQLIGYDTTKKSKFLHNEADFIKIKQLATDETILLNMNSLNFNEVIELCYRELLNNTDDEFYTFYLLEAIRRKELRKSDFLEKAFITSMYKKETVKVITNKKPLVICKDSLKFKAEDHITNHLGRLLFFNEKYNNSNLPSTELNNLDTIKIVTYNDAKNYFNNKISKKGWKSTSFSDFISADNKLFQTNKQYQANGNWFDNYKTISETVNSFNANNADVMEVILYNSDITLTKKEMMTGESVTSLNNKENRDTIIKYISNATSKTIKPTLMDSIMKTERFKLFLLSNAIYENYYSKTKTKDIFSMKTDQELQFAVDAISLAPEILSNNIKDNTKAIALLNLKINYLEMPRFATMSLVPSKFTKMYGEVTTFATAHIIDLKNKRIIYSTKAIYSEKKEDLDRDLANWISQLEQSIK